MAQKAARASKTTKSGRRKMMPARKSSAGLDWTRTKVGPSAYVRVRPLSRSVMEKMPKSTTRFTDVGVLKLVVMNLQRLGRSIAALETERVRVNSDAKNKQHR